MVQFAKVCKSRFFFLRPKAPLAPWGQKCIVRKVGGGKKGGKRRHPHRLSEAAISPSPPSLPQRASWVGLTQKEEKLTSALHTA